jgi:hypothetical protein
MSYSPKISFLSGLSLLLFVAHSSADELQLRWAKAPGDLPFLAEDNAHRGAAYNRSNDTVVVVSRTDGLGVHILDGQTGDFLRSLDLWDVAGGIFALNMVGVADDGAIYAGNLSISETSPHFKLYRWADDDEFTFPDLAFEGDPGLTDLTTGSAQRWGDSLAVRGAGINTQILLGSRAGTLAAILTTGDGVNFTTHPINVSGINGGDIGLGVAFGPGNTFWGTASGRNLKLIEFDLAAGAGQVLQDIPAAAVPAGIALVGADPDKHRLAGINVTTHQIVLWDVTDLESVPVFQSEAALAAGNANVNGTGAVDFGDNLVIALETNNGIALYDIVESATQEPPSILTQPVSQSALEGGTIELSVVATGSAPLSFQWFLNDEPIEGATSSILTLASATPDQSGLYKVFISNEAGSVTSDEAQITITQPAGADLLEPLWTLAPGDRPYLTTDHTQRGMAYNMAEDHVLVLNRAGGISINVLSASTGEHLHVMDTDPTVIAGGTFALNMIGAADDGAIFAGNLTLNGTETSYTLYRWDSDSPEAFPLVAFEGDPGGGAVERWGDTIAVRGSGLNTQVLISSRSGDRAALFTTTDGFSFEPATFSGVSGGLGLAFGEGNTFWATASGQPLRLFEFDSQTGAATMLREFDASVVPSALAPLGVDPENHLLAAIHLGSPDNLKVYDISDLDAGPVILVEQLFATQNPNQNGTGAIAFRNDRLYALGTNNGILAFEVDPALPAPGPKMEAPTLLEDGQFRFTISGQPSTTYQIEGSEDFQTWESLGTIQTGPEGSATFTDATSPGKAHRFYRLAAE